MGEQLEVTVVSTDDKVQCSATARSNPAVTFDYRAPLGNGQGYTGLEGLLMSLSACSGTTLVYLLRKMGKSVSGFQVRAKGIRQDKPPFSLETIFLEFDISSGDVDDAGMKKAMQMMDAACPVWVLMKNNVGIKTDYKIHVA